MNEEEHLLLKWGTVKGWSFPQGECLELLKKYLEDAPWGCAGDHPDDARKAILCEIIDKMSGTIENDWTGKKMTKTEAKKYIMEYGKKEQPTKGSDNE